MEKLRIVVGGYIGLYPVGGATWDYIQYPVGLSLMGHDVYYIEDTMQYPVFQREGDSWNDATACVRYLQDIMNAFGLGNRWAYKDVASNSCFGMTEKQVHAICASADLFINISCSTIVREEYANIPARILIDSDPMFTQMQYALELQNGSESKNWSTRKMVDSHNYLFSFGENIGAKDCRIPTFDYTWIPTRQPVCLDLWKNSQQAMGRSFTSIMNWSGRKKLQYKNEAWGQKDVEFEKFQHLPAMIPDAAFDIVVNKPLNKDSHFDATALTALGWTLHEPSDKVATWLNYKNFIFQSAAEFSVAKETYVKSNSGWFSCRSACYLAAGKPVVTQDTGWSKLLPGGEGLLAFNNMETATAGINTIKADYSRHSKKAKEIAAEYFDANKVLQQMLDQLN